MKQINTAPDGAASAPFALAANHETILDSWVGSSADSLVAAWRVPDNVYTNEDGTRVLDFIDSQTVTTGGYSYSTPETVFNPDGSISTTYVTNTAPVSSFQVICRTTFIVDKAGIIRSWKWNGNDGSAFESERLLTGE